MKKALVLFALFAVIGIANANMLTNGDFSLGYEKPLPEAPGNTLGATGWTNWNSAPGGWNNREINASGLTPNNFHIAIGNGGGYGAGTYQDIAATAGTTYQLSADSELDKWWKNSGYLKLEFYDAGAVMVGFAESPHWTQPGYDTGLPWANYSITGVAPVGTVTVRASLATWGEGGTARFDNAVLVPEPATMIMLGLGSLFLARRKK
jgi:hypothetical protein